MSKVYLITGTSTGFGRALAETVLERGDSAVLTARRPESVEDLVRAYGDRALAVRLDVTDEAQRQAALEQTIEKFGRLDVLVNNAGQGSLGALEEFSDAQIRAQFEVNLFGVLGMTRAALPTFRRQRSGHILNLTSIGGLASMGGFALYCATKFGVEGFSEGLRDEVGPLGIKVTIVEPGAFRTDFAGDANVRPESTIEEYQERLDPVRQYLYGGSGKQPGNPRKAAEAMVQIVESENPPLRLMLGKDAYDVWDQKLAAVQKDLADWRGVGEATAFEGAEVKPVGGSS